ncbi:MAG: pantetheine-phosphate adenylyltransferase [Planctomycetales bacterium 4484_123]|nr:MAG: pantetheine-phosphate adenylyltransferase [Planctomycetales bacterium 4484_123]
MGQQRRIVVFPGTFDPVTNGHLDVIERGRRLFDELIVAVGDNPEKQCLFSPAERAEMIRQLLAGVPDVRVELYEGLTVQFARRVGAQAILRGIRNSSDLQFEFQMALTNRAVSGIETVFVVTRADYAFASSSLIKQIAAMGGDVSALVPELVIKRLRAKQEVSPVDQDQPRQPSEGR